MDQVIPNLWIGGLASALDVEELKKCNIHSILTVMRGRVSVHETFFQTQVDLDDTDESDVLIHLIPSISFIQTELEKDRGVLVHCQAGMSRSATVVTAYLMYSHDMDVLSALDLIKTVRPGVQPNDGFLRQLEIFHQASFKVSRRDKATRMFYLERAVNEIMNGDGSDLRTDMFAKFPRTPSDSALNTPGADPRRRIRCKACRQELAAREHMMDHGQLGPPTPASAGILTPAGSRRPSMSETRSRRSSVKDDAFEPIPLSRRPSVGEHSVISQSHRGSSRSGSMTGTRPKQFDSVAALRRGLSDSLSMSALETEDDPGEEEEKEEEEENTSDNMPVSKTEKHVSVPTSNGFAHPNDLSAQLFANPKLAGLRSSIGGLSMTPLQINVKPAAPVLPPILVNPKCSGYFVEPMKWMEPFLEDGEMEGKIICPNKKCGAKLGNYDWAGVRCSCREWVVPGFCIHRSKVDEIIV